LKVTILTPSFNSKDHILECISSVNEQSFKNIEHIVIDGDSNDGTKELLSNAMVNSVISEKDQGIYDAINKGIKLSCGDIIGILHADDVYSDTSTISDVVEVFLHNNIDLVYGDLDYVSRKNPTKIIRKWRSGNFSSASFSNGWMPPHPAVFIRKSIYEKFGYYDLSYRISSDYNLLFKFFNMIKINRIFYLEKVLVRMRLGGKSNSNFVNILIKSFEDWKIIRSFDYGILKSSQILVLKNIKKVKQFL